jgi:hypothetical protein
MPISIPIRCRGSATSLRALLFTADRLRGDQCSVTWRLAVHVLPQGPSKIAGGVHSGQPSGQAEPLVFS